MIQPYYDEGGVTLYHMNCLDALAAMPQGSIDTVITDPPYHLTQASRNGSPRTPGTGPFGRVHLGEKGFMGKTWDGGDIAFQPETWAAVLRVAKPGAMLLAFGGTRTYHRLACAIEDAGWELRDCLIWLYGSGFPKSLDISKAIDKSAGAEREVVGPGSRHNSKRCAVAHGDTKRLAGGIPDITAPSTDAAKLWNGWGTALKPAWEPILLAMKPLDGTFAENALAHGVTGLHIDGGRIAPEGLRPSRIKIGGKSNGIYGDGLNNSRAVDDTSLGRWPANVLFDEEAAVLLDQQSGELTSGTRAEGVRQGIGYQGIEKGDGGPAIIGNIGGASRFFYVAKASGDERLDNDHPTVKPLTLMKYLCLLTKTPTGGVVLDPFMGSGSTIVAAKEMGRRAIGIDLEEKHVAIAVKRLAQGVLNL